jgi:hypothetical protein
MLLKRLAMAALAGAISLAAIVPAAPGRASVDPKTYSIKVTTMDQGAEISIISLPANETLRHTYHVAPNSTDLNRVVPKARYQFRVMTCGNTFLWSPDTYPTGTLIKVRACGQTPWTGPIV